jgi:hypothetical protein
VEPEPEPQYFVLLAEPECIPVLVMDPDRAMFRIRDIFARIRMRVRILGFVPLTVGSGSVPKSSVT